MQLSTLEANQSESESADDAVGEHQDGHVGGECGQDQPDCRHHTSGDANWKDKLERLKNENFFYCRGTRIWNIK